MDFTATIELVPSNKNKAIVEVTGPNGEWCGFQSFEIKTGDKDSIYEHGYRLASISATFRGGRLSRYRWA